MNITTWQWVGMVASLVWVGFWIRGVFCASRLVRAANLRRAAVVSLASAARAAIARGVTPADHSAIVRFARVAIANIASDATETDCADAARAVITIVGIVAFSCDATSADYGAIASFAQSTIANIAGVETSTVCGPADIAAITRDAIARGGTSADYSTVIAILARDEIARATTDRRAAVLIAASYFLIGVIPVVIGWGIWWIRRA